MIIMDQKTRHEDQACNIHPLIAFKHSTALKPAKAIWGYEQNGLAVGSTDEPDHTLLTIHLTDAYGKLPCWNDIPYPHMQLFWETLNHSWKGKSNRKKSYVETVAMRNCVEEHFYDAQHDTREAAAPTSLAAAQRLSVGSPSGVFGISSSVASVIRNSSSSSSSRTVSQNDGRNSTSLSAVGQGAPKQGWVLSLPGPRTVGGWWWCVGWGGTCSPDDMHICSHWGPRAHYGADPVTVINQRLLCQHWGVDNARPTGCQVKAIVFITLHFDTSAMRLTCMMPEFHCHHHTRRQGEGQRESGWKGCAIQ